jgi:hypothetical protein
VRVMESLTWLTWRKITPADSKKNKKPNNIKDTLSGNWNLQGKASDH